MFSLREENTNLLQQSLCKLCLKGCKLTFITFVPKFLKCNKISVAAFALIKDHFS